MILSDVSVRRPVFTVIITAVLILFGAIGYLSLGVDLMPKVETPFVTVTVGRFLTPFGIFNERLYPVWIRFLQPDPLILPIRTAPTAAGNGTCETISAADAPFIASMSYGFTWSTEIGSATSWVS